MPLALSAIGCINHRYALFIEQVIIIADISKTGANPRIYEHLKQPLPNFRDVALWINVHMELSQSAGLFPSLAKKGNSINLWWVMLGPPLRLR